MDRISGHIKGIGVWPITNSNLQKETSGSRQIRIITDPEELAKITSVYKEKNKSNKKILVSA